MSGLQNDPNAGIHEGPIGAAPVSPGDVDLAEFANLSALAAEFFVIDRSALPFRAVDEVDIRRLYGFRPLFNISRGNYAAGGTSCSLRKESQRNVHRFHDLRAVLDLPTELVLEIFSHLHPIDLYSLIRTTKGLRSLLLSRKSSSIWEQASLEHADIPSCPADVSYPEWASLLFGPATCDECGYLGATPDFTYRKRRCAECMNEAYCQTGDMNLFPPAPIGYEGEWESLWSMVPWSHAYNSTYYHASLGYPRRYLKQDCENMLEHMKRFMTAIASNEPNAREDYEFFKNSTMAHTVDRVVHTEMVHSWFRTIEVRLDEEYVEILLPPLAKRVLNFLVELGYEEEDIENAESNIRLELSNPRVYTFKKKVILRRLPILRQLVESERLARLEREHALRIVLRENKVKELYENFKKSIEPLDWGHLPNLERIYKLRPISDYIFADSSEIEEPSEEKIDCISAFVDGWMANAKSELLRLLPEEFVSTLCDLERENWLDLASVVFVCPAHRHRAPALIGWRGISHHLNCVARTDPEGRSDFASSSFDFNLAGSRAASIFAARLGFDPAAARPSDLDSRKARFICTHCPLTEKRGMKGRHVLTWKECIDRVIRNPEHNGNTFTILSKAATQSILAREPLYPDPAEKFWCCRHCPTHLKVPVQRRAAASHVYDIHGVSRPQVDIDYFYRWKPDQVSRKLYYLSTEPPSHYCCRKCPKTDQARLWLLDRVQAHLHDKHNIKDAQEGPHYFLLELQDIEGVTL